ncbi:MAG: hypothetical protein AAB458_02620 [Patescibacteria group bacterium]
MFHIKELFDRYKHITPPDASIRSAVVKALAPWNIHTQERSVRVIHTVVYLDIDSVSKNVVFLNKNKILSVIAESIGKEGVVKDIR